MSARPDIVSTPKLISVVVPALDEQDNVQGILELMTELDILLSHQAGYLLELVLVDDGSSDSTCSKLLQAAPQGLLLTVVELSRTFGSHQAISAGLRHARGDCAMVVGADRQEPLALLVEFVREWEQGHEVVWGVRRARSRSWRSELPSRGFSYLFSRFASLENYPPEGPSGLLVDRCVIDALNEMPEHNRNVLALVAWLGFRQTQVRYDQLPRLHGESRWTRKKMLKLAVDSLIQFSSMPLRLCTFSGLGVAGAGLVYAILLVLRALSGASTPAGWPTLLVVILVLGGIQLTVVGVMGEYLWRAVEEVRRRPLYVVRNVTTDPRRNPAEGVVAR
jgi:dolichol-phosphate mannosyltransferase